MYSLGMLMLAVPAAYAFFEASMKLAAKDMHVLAKDSYNLYRHCVH